MLPVLMNAARCRSMRRRSMATRSAISAPETRTSSWKVFVASFDTPITAIATMRPATRASMSSTRVNPLADRRRARVMTLS